MSQFIQLHKNLPFQSPAILKGILSKVVQPSLKSSQKRSFSQQRLSHKQSTRFFDSTMDSRYVQQVKKADDLQNIIIDIEYKKMKKKLLDYGRSENHRVQKIVRNQPQQKYFDSLQSPTHIPSLSLSKQKQTSPLKLVQQLQHEHKQAKLRYSIGKIHSQINSHDRTIFVDRKYNKQFVVKFSALKQAEQVKQMKLKYQQFLAINNHANPLVKQAKRSIERKKYFTQYEKSSFQAIGLTKVNNMRTKTLYQPRKKEKSLQNSLFFQQIHDQKPQSMQNECKNKLNKTLSCHLMKPTKLSSIKLEKQNQPKEKFQKNHEKKSINIRKKQKKITWEKEIKN